MDAREKYLQLKALSTSLSLSIFSAMRRVQWNGGDKIWRNLSCCLLPSVGTGVEEVGMITTWMLQYRGDVSVTCQATCTGVLFNLYKDYMKTNYSCFIEKGPTWKSLTCSRVQVTLSVTELSSVACPMSASSFVDTVDWLHVQWQVWGAYW